MKIFLYALLLCVAVASVHCGNAESDKTDDVLLAKVYNKSLYLSELDGVVPEDVSQEDSALMVAAYVQRWARDQLLMYEAERNIPKDLNIDELVRNYRASLVRFNFEEQIIAEKLDSVVTDDEMRNFYDNNKEQFQLESMILKCVVLKIPSDDKSEKEFNKLWNSRKPGDMNKLKSLAAQKAVLALLDEDKWYKLQEVAALLPKGTLTSENMSSRREGTLRDGDFRYYYRVLESAQGKSTAPFDYVKEQASRIILHKRKQDLLENWKKSLYDRELKRENIIIK
ncbi:MAG: peptidyl-prolyl cis-trans isomerase [Saprospiraceae bacterium]|nr:peptidyl-prolyl cis-trans isomerase [Saprospiraceae bacterium]